MHAAPPSCPALVPCTAADTSTSTPLVRSVPALHHELSPDLLQAGLRSGLHPRRWLRLRRSLPSRLVGSALLPPMAVVLAAATVTLIGLITAVVVGSGAALVGLDPYLGVIAGAIGATGSALAGAAMALERRRRERRGELPLDWARPLMTELVDWLTPVLEPDQPVAFDFHAGESTAITLALRGDREVTVGVRRRGHGPRVGVVLELPVSAELARRQSWPGDLGVTVAARGDSCLVQLALTENTALPRRASAIARIVAELCGATRTLTCPMANEHAAVRVVSRTERVDAPAAGPRRAVASWRAEPAQRGVGLARALRSADLVTWTSGASSAAVLVGACVDATTLTAAAVGLPLAAAARGTAAMVTRPRRAAGPPSAPRQTGGLAHETLELADDGRSLRLGETRIDLDEPFRVTLTRAPSAHQGLREITLELFQLQSHGHVALRTSVVAHDGPELDALTVWDTRVPRIDAESFAAWLWPTVCFFAEAHGHRPPFAVKVEARQQTTL